MRIEHIALWTKDIEKSREFYCTHFGGTSNEIYTNTKNQFNSYFITFESGCRLEIMDIVGLEDPKPNKTVGLAHMAFSVGSKENVDTLTERLRSLGYTIQGEPRTTGDGYYESIVLDPDGNFVEITS